MNIITMDQKIMFNSLINYRHTGLVNDSIPTKLPQNYERGADPKSFNKSVFSAIDINSDNYIVKILIRECKKDEVP